MLNVELLDMLNYVALMPINITSYDEPSDIHTRQDG